MAENRDFKVSYVRISEEGLERISDVSLKNITSEDKMDIKSLMFLPIASGAPIDITPELKGFPILENLYLPSMLVTTMKGVAKECPMLKSILMLSKSTVNNSLDQTVVKVNAMEEEGDNTAQFRTFVETTKDGKQTFLVNAKQVLNYELVIEEKVIERLTMSQVKNYISGENGIIASIDEINASIDDERCKIEITAEMLESLLGIFVEKGVTFEEFTIDFSKLYDKIESYKNLAKSVNQVSIKEEVETNIVETYQTVLQRHYDNLVLGLSDTVAKLVAGVDLETEALLLGDLSSYLSQVVVDSPAFDEDYKEGDALDTILSELPTAIARNIKSSRERGLARKYLSQVVSNLRTNKEELYALIEARLSEKAGIEDTRNAFAERFGLDETKSKQAMLLDQIVEVVATKNFGVIAKEDILGVVDRVEKRMGNGEIRSKEMLELITQVVAEYPTKEEIKGVLVDFIAKNGYSAINLTKA